MNGKLYLVATPIGNLEDITLRALNVLKDVDIIAAEDTRNTLKLLNFYEIKKPLISNHRHNEKEKKNILIEELKNGKSIAVVSDAGTPGISDPGEELVKIAYEAGIEVTSLPGAAACITALTLSGLSTRRFAFEAFLPKDKKERKRVLEELKDETRTIIIYEAPHHLIKTLEELEKELDNRKITLCRELTKKYEEAHRTTIHEVLDYYKDKEPRGEYVLVLEGKTKEQVEEERKKEWENLTLEEHMQVYEEKGVSHKEAMKLVAKDRGISKRDVYQALI